MEAYCLDTSDGLLHLFIVHARKDEELELEAIHSDGYQVLRIPQTMNTCLFEVFLRIGILKRFEQNSLEDLAI